MHDVKLGLDTAKKVVSMGPNLCHHASVNRCVFIGEGGRALGWYYD